MGPLYSSFILFIAGSIVFAVAKSMSVLIAGRVLQGLGAGGLDVLNEIIIADITTLKERPLYLGFLAIPMAGGSILGPIMGGLLTDYASWRWIGWINLPISAVGLALVFIFLNLETIEQSLSEKMKRLDWGGMALFAVGCTLFATPLTWAGAMFPWSSYKTILPLVFGAVILGLFTWYESKPAEPVFPYRIFKNTTSSVTLLASFLHGAVVFSYILYTPLFFQAIYFDSPIKSAVNVLPLCCFSVAFSILAAVAVETMRKYKMVILGSWVFSAVGIGLFALWDQDSSLAVKVGFQIIAGVGTGSLFSVLNLPMQASAPHVDDMGLAAGILVSFRLFGGLIGLAMCSTVFNSVFGQRIHDVGILPEDLSFLEDAQEAIGFIPFLRNIDASEHLDKIIETYRVSISAVYLMLAGVSALGFIVSFFIKEISLENEELGKQQFKTEK